ncbi:DEAD/DEAH box helicase family protein [Acinetobacter sp. CFCC 10889]|uniref:DEAD/DEAH box helicase family protein n=1 Tax=Acinetobacter sp. CFCC 10889 TaxID=1775557 RepID=UPI000DCF66B3|nr:DEAD/DEAH box helicase family protein [Acinetobacter sp. CFCC 10889]
MELQSLVINNTARIEQNHAENTMTIYVGDSAQRLSNIIKDFPDNCYVNKQITGCGGTTLVLRNLVDYVVLVPYVNLLKSKVADNKDIDSINLIIRGGKWTDNDDEISEQLLDRSKPRKIICTFDSLPALMKIKGFNPSEFKLLVDESHTLVNLGSFKAPKCEFILQNYSKFSSAVFLTATPTKREYFPDMINHLPLCTIEWDNVREVKFNLQRLEKGVSINNALFNLCLSFLLGREEGNAHIFYNSVTEITKVMEWLSKIIGSDGKPAFNRDDIRLICSKSPNNEKKLDNKLGAWGLVDDVVDNPVGKLNFYTSTMFEGADIYDKKGKTYIIINGLRDYTKIDFFVLIPQICGRLRDSEYNESINILLSNVPEVASCTKDEWQSTVLTKIQGSNDLLEALNSPVNKDKPAVVKALLDSIGKDPYIFLNDDTKQYYVSDVALKSELQSYEAMEATYVVRDVEGVDYQASGFSASFRDLLNDESKQVQFTSPISGMSKLLSGYQSFSETMEEYVTAREKPDEQIYTLIDARNLVFRKYFDSLGADKIKALRYRNKDITELYEAEFSSQDNKRTIQARLALRNGEFISNVDAKEKLKTIYEALEINKAAKAKDLFDWYDLKMTKYKGVNGLVVTKIK